MNYLKSTLTLFLLTIVSLASKAQVDEAFTLKNAIDYGLAHNTSILKGRLETERNNFQYKEALAGYLPQAKGSASVLDNLKLQTSILPGEVFGQPGTSVAVKFGTKFNVTAGIDVNQVLFDASQLMGLKVAGQAKNLVNLNQQKTKEQLTYDIATAYYSAQITAIQKGIVENNLIKIDSLITITKVQFDNGFAKKVDYDRLLINRTNTQTDIENVNINFQNQLYTLKYYMAMPMDKIIVLAKDNYEINRGFSANANFQNNTDVRLLQNQNMLNDIKLKQIKAGYLPSLSFGFRYAYQVQKNDFKIIGNNSNWFPNSYLSFNLNIPIFDGGTRSAKMSQVKIDMQQNLLDEQNLMQNLAYQSARSSNKLTQNQASVSVQQNNIKLAEEVFAISQAQFKGGIGSMSDLINAETSLKEAQINYLNALVQIKIAELDILKSSGNLNNLTNY